MDAEASAKRPLGLNFSISFSVASTTLPGIEVGEPALAHQQPLHLSGSPRDVEPMPALACATGSKTEPQCRRLGICGHIIDLDARGAVEHFSLSGHIGPFIKSGEP